MASEANIFFSEWAYVFYMVCFSYQQINKIFIDMKREI